MRLVLKRLIGEERILVQVLGEEVGLNALGRAICAGDGKGVADRSTSNRARSSASSARRAR
uniref:hypothetical protein n=1 Tax=Brevundimonas sp. TaxID=1871086 RepID=UPI00289EC62E